MRLNPFWLLTGVGDTEADPDMEHGVEVHADWPWGQMGGVPAHVYCCPPFAHTIASAGDIDIAAVSNNIMKYLKAFFAIFSEHATLLFDSRRTY
jgi:hypothetical protein